ncbi:hypothetical protein BDB01DRAFT_90376 [Pilobolus umbonatus]|nr:hypothetical protein BDB01DRAFT_90376 [Pilobolus umbonatus]
MIHFFPVEINQQILSWLNHYELYQLRRVCKLWRQLSEDRLRAEITKDKLWIEYEGGHSECVFNVHHQYVEFSGCEIGGHRIRLRYSQWPSYHYHGYSHLTTEEEEQVKFHEHYHPAHHKYYVLPEYDPHQQTRYVGDQHMIMQFQYMDDTVHVNWIRISLDFILSGFTRHLPSSSLYQDRFRQLQYALSKHYCFTYDPYSEPILDAIVNHRPLSHTLIEYIQSHSDQYRTPLYQLQYLLEGAGVDAHMLWKYPFAVSFITGKNHLLSEEEMVRRIKMAEEDWCRLRLKLTRFNK